MKTRNIARIGIGTALLLLIPLVAMRFTDEVDWDITDFIVMGGLLFGTGLLYELAANKIHNPRYRIITGIVLVAVLLLVWGELAVGIFGTPFAGS